MSFWWLLERTVAESQPTVDRATLAECDSLANAAHRARSRECGTHHGHGGCSPESLLLPRYCYIGNEMTMSVQIIVHESWLL